MLVRHGKAFVPAKDSRTASTVRYEPGEHPPLPTTVGLGLQFGLLAITGIVLTPAIVVRGRRRFGGLPVLGGIHRRDYQWRDDNRAGSPRRPVRLRTHPADGDIRSIHFRVRRSACSWRPEPASNADRRLRLDPVRTRCAPLGFPTNPDAHRWRNGAHADSSDDHVLPARLDRGRSGGHPSCRWRPDDAGDARHTRCRCAAGYWRVEALGPCHRRDQRLPGRCVLRSL